MFIEGVFSVLPQVGKTTFGINTIKSNPLRDHYFATHDQNSVLDDAVGKAIKLGVTPWFLSDKKSNNNERTKDLLNMSRDPRVFFGLGNMSQLSEIEHLAYAAQLSGNKQHLHIDEIHKFCLEPESSKETQRDSWLRIIIKKRFVDFLSTYSASAHDVLMAPYVTFDKATIISPYEGQKAFEDIVWHLKDQNFFNKTREAYKNNERPPTEFIDFISQYPTMIVNIHTKNEFHFWLVRNVPDYRQYNQKFKEDSPHLVGGLSLGMSSSFDSNFIMFNRSTNTHRALMWQAVGRVYGRKIPHVCCTEEDKEEMENYYENMQKLCKEEIILMPGEERSKYIEDKFTWVNPISVANPKLIRKITTSKTYKEGSQENCVETYHSIWVGTELASGEEWRGDGGKAAQEIEKKFRQQNPDIKLEGISKAIQEKEEVYKFRDGKRVADYRIGQNYSQPGRAYVIIRTGEYKGDYSFFNHDGTILSNRQLKVGTIHVETKSRATA
jgi:hypothetical protein